MIHSTGARHGARPGPNEETAMNATNYPAARILYQVATIVPANKE